MERIAAQTIRRISPTIPPGATRIGSLHDPDARPIAKGRLGRPVECGDQARLVDNEDGVTSDHNHEVGNPTLTLRYPHRRSNAWPDVRAVFLEQ
ncbi:MAG: hypothetical protein ACLPVY_09765 [Acidimicrobiia bacterium]